MATPMVEQVLTTTLAAASQVEVTLLSDPTLTMLSLQPGAGVSASVGFVGTAAEAARPTNAWDGPVANIPIPRDPSTGARATKVFLWSLAGGSVNFGQYAPLGS